MIVLSVMVVMVVALVFAIMVVVAVMIVMDVIVVMRGLSSMMVGRVVIVTIVVRLSSIPGGAARMTSWCSRACWMLSVRRSFVERWPSR